MNRVLKLLIILGWLGSAGWLYRTELAPRWFPGQAQGYRAFILGGPEVRERWMKVELQGQPIGYARSFSDINEDTADPELIMNNQLHVLMPVGANRLRVRALTEIVLDGGYDLRGFTLALSLANAHYRAEGTPREGNRFTVSLTGPGVQQEQDLEIPDQAMLFSIDLELAMRRLAPGQKTTLQLVDPLFKTARSLRLVAEGTDTLKGPDQRPVTATRVRAELEGITLLSWIGPDGRMLKQETPFGWTLVACSPEEALDIVDQMNRIQDQEVGNDMIQGLIRMLNPGATFP